MNTAIILAAGRGSRMGELTEAVPKCLLSLAGKTLLEWQTQALARAGMRHIHLVTGYRGELLRGQHATFENSRWAETNMVRTLICAADVLTRTDCIVAYADIVYRFGHVAALAQSSEDIAVTYDLEWERLWRLRFVDPLSDAETFEQKNGLLTVIGGKPTNLGQVKGQFMGLIKCTPAGYARIERHVRSLPEKAADALDVTSLLAGLLLSGERIGAVPVRGGWLEADNPEDLRRYEANLADSDARFTHDFRD